MKFDLCPQCGSTNLKEVKRSSRSVFERVCNDCDAYFGQSVMKEKMPWASDKLNFVHTGQEMRALQELFDKK